MNFRQLRDKYKNWDMMPFMTKLNLLTGELDRTETERLRLVKQLQSVQRSLKDFQDLTVSMIEMDAKPDGLEPKLAKAQTMVKSARKKLFDA